MKIDCGPSAYQKIKAKKEWHRWFAWRPVRLGPHDCRWLEYVWRKGTIVSSWDDWHWVYDYRPSEDGKPEDPEPNSRGSYGAVL